MCYKQKFMVEMSCCQFLVCLLYFLPAVSLMVKFTWKWIFWAILFWTPNKQEKWHTGQGRLKMLPQDEKQYWLDEILMKWGKWSIVSVVLKDKVKKLFCGDFVKKRWELIPMGVFVCDVCVCVCVCVRERERKRGREMRVLIKIFFKKRRFFSRKILLFDIWHNWGPESLDNLLQDLRAG